MRRDAAATELEDMGAMTYARQSGAETPSVATAQGEKEICWYCNFGRKIKTAHTYREGCQKYIRGATRLEMIQAARGGKVGRKRLLEKLGQPGTQPPQAELRRDQANKDKTRIKKKEKATSSETSSTMAGGETSTQKVGNKKRPRKPLPRSSMEEE